MLRIETSSMLRIETFLYAKHRDFLYASHRDFQSVPSYCLLLSDYQGGQLCFCQFFFLKYLRGGVLNLQRCKLTPPKNLYCYSLFFVLPNKMKYYLVNNYLTKKKAKCKICRTKKMIYFTKKVYHKI